MHARGEEWICCSHEQESIRMLLKHSSKLTFIPFVCAKPALPVWNRGKKQAPAAQSAQILCWHDTSWPSILCSMGCWLQKEKSQTQWESTGEQGNEQWTKVLIQSQALFNTELSPQLRAVAPGVTTSSSTQTQKKCVLVFKGDWGSRNWGVETEPHWVTCMDKQMQECTGKAKGPPEQALARVKHSAAFSCS